LDFKASLLFTISECKCSGTYIAALLNTDEKTADASQTQPSLKIRIVNTSYQEEIF